MKSDTGSDVAGTGILDTQRIVTGVGSDRVGANLVGCFFGQKIASRDRAVLSAGCAELPVLGLTAQLGSRFGATAPGSRARGLFQNVQTPFPRVSPKHRLRRWELTSRLRKQQGRWERCLTAGKGVLTLLRICVTCLQGDDKLGKFLL